MNTFQEYQAAVKQVPVSLRNNRDRISLPVSGLQQEAGKLGSLLTAASASGKLTLTPGQSGEIRERAGEILWCLATLCNESGIALQDVAEDNARQLQERASALDPDSR